MNHDSPQTKKYNFPTIKSDLNHQDLPRSSSYGDPLVSIITVVFDGEETIETTIQSVINQSYKNIEYIVIDGGSTDRTLDIINKYQNHITYWVSEPDRGVYDAMNKGIDRSVGDWLIFLGADDRLFDELVIEKLIQSLPLEREPLKKAHKNPLVIFGGILYTNGQYFKSFLNIRTLIRNTIQHQSAMYHRSLFDSFRYDPSLRINSDYELNLLIYLRHIQAKYISLTISICSYGGLSTNFNNREQAIEEFSIIRKKYISFFPNQVINTILNIRLSIKLLIFRFLNERFKKW